MITIGRQPTPWRADDAAGHRRVSRMFLEKWDTSDSTIVKNRMALNP